MQKSKEKLHGNKEEVETPWFSWNGNDYGFMDFERFSKDLKEHGMFFNWFQTKNKWHAQLSMQDDFFEFSADSIEELKDKLIILLGQSK